MHVRAVWADHQDLEHQDRVVRRPAALRTVRIAKRRLQIGAEELEIHHRPPAEPAHPVAGDALFAAARTLLPVLEAGRPLNAAILRDAMTEAFGAADTDGAWVWKDAYEAAEAAVVVFMQHYVRRPDLPDTDDIGDRGLPGRVDGPDIIEGKRDPTIGCLPT